METAVIDTRLAATPAAAWSLTAIRPACSGVIPGMHASSSRGARLMSSRPGMKGSRDAVSTSR